MRSNSELTVNWKRSVFVDSVIDEELVRKLTPAILTLRQDSAAPITVGIDSPGGDLHAMEVLIDLLEGPDQNGRRGRIVSVVTRRASSAAGLLLSLSDYAVALSHSEVFCHDVRITELSDVTPERARVMSAALQIWNDRYALRLADRIIERLVWTYIDLIPQFSSIPEHALDKRASYDEIVSHYSGSSGSIGEFDLAGFATTLWNLLSPPNRELIDTVMTRLGDWSHVTRLVDSIPTYRTSGSRVPGLLDGALHLHKEFRRSAPFGPAEDDLKLLLSLLVTEIALWDRGDFDFSLVVERGLRDFQTKRSLNDKKHIDRATELMLAHGYIFSPIYDAPNGKSGCPTNPPDAEAILPLARIFWLFCVELCRELFYGDHTLSPADAQLLGLVDEVCGGGEVQSAREAEVARARAARNSRRRKMSKRQAQR